MIMIGLYSESSMYSECDEVSIQIRIMSDIQAVSENQIRSISNMFLKNSDTDH